MDANSTIAAISSATSTALPQSPLELTEVPALLGEIAYTVLYGVSCFALGMILSSLGIGLGVYPVMKIFTLTTKPEEKENQPYQRPGDLAGAMAIGACVAVFSHTLLALALTVFSHGWSWFKANIVTSGCLASLSIAISAVTVLVLLTAWAYKSSCARPKKGQGSTEFGTKEDDLEAAIAGLDDRSDLSESSECPFALGH